MYIGSALVRGLGCEHELEGLSGGAFPDKRVMQGYLGPRNSGGHVFQEHLDANRYNLFVLELMLPKFILHVRDPRQATLSWLHHFNKSHPHPRHTLETVYYRVPDSYYDLDNDGQLDYWLESWLPILVRWTADWLAALNDSRWKLDVLVTRFEDFRADPEQFFAQILDFYCIDGKDWVAPDSPVQGALHYRKGKTDEWRQRFTARQTALCEMQIPNELALVFGWN